MDENHDRMLEKLDLILRLVQDCNSTLKRMSHQVRVDTSIASLVMMLKNQKLLMMLSQSQKLLMSRNQSQIQKLLKRIQSQKW